MDDDDWGDWTEWFRARLVTNRGAEEIRKPTLKWKDAFAPKSRGNHGARFKILLPAKAPNTSAPPNTHRLEWSTSRWSRDRTVFSEPPLDAKRASIQRTEALF